MKILVSITTDRYLSYLSEFCQTCMRKVPLILVKSNKSLWSALATSILIDQIKIYLASYLCILYLFKVSVVGQM